MFSCSLNKLSLNTIFGKYSLIFRFYFVINETISYYLYWIYNYCISYLQLTIPQAFNKMKFFAIAFLLIVLVGSTFGANYWCGHPRIAANACCWNGEKQSAGWKHSSVNRFPSHPMKSCPSGFTDIKSVITDSKLPRAWSDKCYTCAKRA